MRSVAERLREDSSRRLAQMTPEERLRLAFALGEADLALLMSAQSLSAVEARARIARYRQVGRVPSCAAQR